MILKIILQLGVGISTLITFYLDYKWHDKRTKSFKKGRDFLRLFTILILLFSISITYIDERNSNIEKKELKNDLKSMSDSLSDIKQIGMKLNTQIQPLINLAKQKYPNLPLEEALIKLESEIDSLQKKTSSLESNDEKRKLNEQKLSILKKTKPKLDFALSLKNNKLSLVIKFLNEVPIQFRPYLSDIRNEQGTSFKKPGNRVYDNQQAFPNTVKENSTTFEFFDLTGYNLPQTSTYLFKVFVHYKSIYSDVNNPELKEETREVNYVLDPVSMEMKPFK